MLGSEFSEMLMQVWYDNVPHTRLVEDKGGQNWISRNKDKFIFPGGGTQFIHGANQYLDQISKVFNFHIIVNYKSCMHVFDSIF